MCQAVVTLAIVKSLPNWNVALALYACSGMCGVVHGLVSLCTLPYNCLQVQTDNIKLRQHQEKYDLSFAYMKHVLPN